MSPQAEKTTPEPLKPSSLTGTQCPVGAGGTPTSPTRMASGQDVVNNSMRPEMSQPSPWSHGLKAPGGSQNGEGLSLPQSRKQL
jgi:hypothetical protein